jgi:hypothetical protein
MLIATDDDSAVSFGFDRHFQNGVRSPGATDLRMKESLAQSLALQP